MDLELIKRILPHREPMLLIDEVLSYTLLPENGATIVTSKEVTGDEDVFKGYFPGNPIWPGVYTVEGFA